MNFRDHVIADVERLPEAQRDLWQRLVSTNLGGEWTKLPVAEVELRAWLEARATVAVEPVVLNRHHLCPQAPQPAGSGSWPRGALYCGRVPMTASSGPAWRYARVLGNPYSKETHPDALERYRLDLRRWLREDNAAAVALAADPRSPLRRHPAADAIRDLTPASALVCSCVTTPWTPAIVVRPDDPLPASVTCHCHLIVAAWRAMQRTAARAAAAIPTVQAT